MKKILIGLLVVLAIIIVICICAGLAVKKFGDIASETNQTGNTGNNNQGEINFTDEKIDLNIESINNNNISSIEVDKVLLPEVELISEGLKLLEAKGWNGDEDSVKLSFNDINKTQWEEWKQDDAESLTGLTIPSELEGIYTSSEAQSEIKSLAFQMRKEYLAALKAKGVAQKYIDELDKVVLPEDESRFFFYFNNEAVDMPTQVEALRGDADTDFTRQQMHLNVIDFNNGARLLRRSGVLGTPSDRPSNDMEYEKALRNMAMRWYIYHELTHSLGRAYMNLNVGAEYKNNLLSYRDYENTLTTVDESYLWNWGAASKADAYAENFDVASESQAEGISYQLFTEGYNMSAKQKEVVWEHLFGRLESNRDKLNAILTLFQEKYPDKNPKDMYRYISSIEESIPYGEDSVAYERFSNKAAAMSPYVGYFNPLRPEDTDKYWAKLK